MKIPIVYEIAGNRRCLLVEPEQRIVIGRSPICDVVLDGEEVRDVEAAVNFIKDAEAVIVDLPDSGKQEHVLPLAFFVGGFELRFFRPALPDKYRQHEANFGLTVEGEGIAKCNVPSISGKPILLGASKNCDVVLQESSCPLAQLALWPLSEQKVYVQVLDDSSGVDWLGRGVLYEAESPLPATMSVSGKTIHLFAFVEPTKPTLQRQSSPPPLVESLPASPLVREENHSSDLRLFFNKDGKQLGPFSEKEALQMLKSGKITAQDLAWKEGASDWIPLYKLMKISTPPPIKKSFPPPQTQNQSALPRKPQPAAETNILAQKIRQPLVWVLLIATGLWLYVEAVNPNNERQSNINDSGNSPQAAQPGIIQQPSEGNGIIVDASEGTTFQKEQHKQKYLGTRLNFKGTVHDVTANDTLVVQIDSGNYAEVKFATTNVSSFREGQIIWFSAVIEEFGTGILVHHVLAEAQLSNQQASGAGKNKFAVSNAPEKNEETPNAGNLAGGSADKKSLSDPPSGNIPEGVSVHVDPRLKLIGPKILGIQLGDKIESVCQKFNAEYASNMNGQRMEVRKFAGDAKFVCSTPDGLRAVEQLDKLNKTAGDGNPLDLLSGLMVGGQGVMQAQMAESPIIYADKDGIIWKYVLGSTATNNFFGRSAFMSNQEFANFLSAKYELPDLEGEMVETNKPFSNSTDYVPEYHGFSREGFSVRIDKHKAIFIEKL